MGKTPGQTSITARHLASYIYQRDMELGTCIIGSGVVPEKATTLYINYKEIRFCYMLYVLMGRETLLLRDFPPVLLLTYSDAEASPDAV